MDRAKYIRDMSDKFHQENGVVSYLEFVTLRNKLLAVFDAHFNEIISAWNVKLDIANGNIIDDQKLPVLIRRSLFDIMAKEDYIWEGMSLVVGPYMYTMALDFIKDELSTLEAQAMASLYF